MHRTFVNINNHSFGFFDYREALSYVLNLEIAHCKYVTLSTLKENACTACDLVSELLLILSDQVEEKIDKTNLKKLATRITKAKEYYMRLKSKETFLLAWGDQMMSIEGKGLLHGFGFGNKQFGDVIRGNSEKISVTKVDR